MKVELQQELINNHPHLYANHIYFECLDGWYDLIKELSDELEPKVIAFRKAFPNEELYPVVSQVKEKYGTLRFYMHFASDEMSELICEAERMSTVTCEACGSKEAICKSTGAWVRTRCESCE